jgi:hypothetical protein
MVTNYVRMLPRYVNRLTIRFNGLPIHDKCSRDMVNVSRIMLKVSLDIHRGSIYMVISTQDIVAAP